MTVVALADLRRNGQQATRFREYGFILLAGAVGAVVGFVNDLITSSISPEYFLLGKGLDEGPDLRFRAGLFGLQVGFSAGIIGGAICLFVTRRKSSDPQVEFGRLLRMLWIPVIAAVFGGLVVPLVCAKFDPAHFSAQLAPILDDAMISHFREVWWIHIGLYLGMAIGLVIMLIRATGQRKRSGIHGCATRSNG